MVSQWLGVATVCAATALGVFATMVSDEGWQRGDQTVVRAAAASVALAAVATLLPAGFIVGFEAIGSAETLRGRTIPAFMPETVAGVCVLVGAYLAWVARARPFVAGDDVPTSAAAMRIVWTVAGAGIALAAVVALVL